MQRFKLKIKNTTTQYGLIAIILHWIMAVILTGLFSVGLYMTTLDYYDPLYHTLPEWHKSFGLLTLLLLIVRYIWKLRNVKPDVINTLHRHEMLLASLTHNLFYLLILSIGISGYLMSTAEGKSIEFFSVINISAVTHDVSNNMQEYIGDTHLILAILLSVLVLLHMLAALKHHFIDKDSTLKRMITIQTGDNK